MSDESKPQGENHQVRGSCASTVLRAARNVGVMNGEMPANIRRPASNDATMANPCLTCGACCAYFRVSFYCGEIADDSGAGIVPPELVVQVAPLRAAMKGTENGRGRCIALRGEIGSNQVHCGIYQQRPSPCREFEPWLPDGSPEPDCQRVRALFGLPPLPARWMEDDDDIDPPAHAA